MVWLRLLSPLVSLSIFSLQRYSTMNFTCGSATSDVSARNATDLILAHVDSRKVVYPSRRRDRFRNSDLCYDGGTILSARAIFFPARAMTKLPLCG